LLACPTIITARLVARSGCIAANYLVPHTCSLFTQSLRKYHVSAKLPAFESRAPNTFGPNTFGGTLRRTG
jgi:hypothetical protein